MNKLFAILPCYNEEQNISSLTGRWVNLIPEFEARGFELSVFCVNDCSTDSTKSVIEELTKRYPESVFLIDHEVNKGLGGVLLTGFKHFLGNASSGDICVVMDGDDTHDPVYSLPMLDKIKNGEADCVIASRYQNGSQTVGVSAVRRFVSWGAKEYYALMLGVKNVRDYTCGFRAYTYDIIEKAYAKFGDNLVERRSFACMMEVLYKLKTVGAVFGEVPFELRYDYKKGESKMRVFKTAKESIVTAAKLKMNLK